MSRRVGTRKRRARAFAAWKSRRKGGTGHWTRTRSVWRMRLSSGQTDYYQVRAFNESRHYFKAGAAPQGGTTP